MPPSDRPDAVRHFCTYFDKNYLSRGLALHESLRAQHPTAHLFICCLDEATYEYLRARALPGVTLLAQQELEAYDAELVATRSQRSRVEYYFTSTPCWIRFIFAKHADVDLLTYIDADCRFYSSVEPVFAEIATSSVAIVEHRFPAHLAHLENHGRFNVGWVTFRRDANGTACLDWWRARCIEWCFDRLEADRYGDQKYLDQWPTRFAGVHVIEHRGVNLGPWNVTSSTIGFDGAVPTIDGQPLVCFHFHGLKHVAGPLYETGLRAYGIGLGAQLRRRVYEPYLQRLLAYERTLAEDGITAGHAHSLRTAQPPTVKQQALKLVSMVRLLLSRTFLLAR